MVRRTASARLSWPSTVLAQVGALASSKSAMKTDAPESQTGRWLAKNGQSLYHLCFEVEDIDGALEELRQKNVKLIDETPRTGHGGARIAFLRKPHVKAEKSGPTHVEELCAHARHPQALRDAAALARCIVDRDVPVIQSFVTITALIVVTINLSVDVVYSWLDPRIRLYDRAR